MFACVTLVVFRYALAEYGAYARNHPRPLACVFPVANDVGTYPDSGSALARVCLVLTFKLHRHTYKP